MVIPRAPMEPPIKTLPWAAPFMAPLEADPWTVISAPALSHPISSDAGPIISILVFAFPKEPVRWPEWPMIRIFISSLPASQSRPPIPCWPKAWTSSFLLPRLTCWWIISSRTREGIRFSPSLSDLLPATNI